MSYFRILKFCIIWILILLFPLLALNPPHPFFERDFSHFLPELQDVYGVSFSDIDGDLYPDLYLVRFRNLNRAFLNRKGGRKFIDRTISSRLGGNLFPGHEKNLELGVSVLDLNNDGREDVCIFGWGKAFAILQHLPGRLFKEISFSLNEDSLDINHGVWSDIDHNGTLDLLVTNEHGPNHLYLHDGYFHFTDVSAQYRISSETHVSQGALFADLNNDGYDDLLVCNWFAPDELYLNYQGKFFKRINLPLSHFQNSWTTNSASVLDVDNDGDLDLILCDRSGHSQLYLNQTLPGDTSLFFSVADESLGLHNIYPAYGALTADFDNNGWQDVFFTNIGPNLLYLNQSGKFYLAWEENLDTKKNKYSTGAAAADIDKDGDLDLFVGNKDTFSILYINKLQKKSFIRVQLQGVESNHDAIGSRVYLYREISQDSLILSGYQQLTSSQGYLSTNEKILHFGISDKGPYALKVIFPSGKIRWLTHLQENHVYFLQEEVGFIASIKRFLIILQAKLHQPGFVLNFTLFILLIIAFLTFFRFGSKRYRWNTSQIMLYSSLILFFLYLIFFIFRRLNFLEIMKIQWGFLLTFFAILALFHERSRKLELSRRNIRSALQRFSDEVLFIRDNDQLVQTLLNTLFQQFPLTWIGYFSYGENSVLTWYKPEEEKVEVHTIHLPEAEIFFSSRIHFRQEINKLLIKDMGFAPDIIMTLSLKEEHFGFFVLRSANYKFLREDIHVLEILGNQASIAFAFNGYIKKLQQMTEQITETRIKEKYIHELEAKNKELQRLYRELQETQAQAIQNEKMISLGQLIAGIAHELNNPISFIYANLKEMENITKFLDNILSQPEKLSSMNDHILKEIYYVKEELPKIIDESLEGSKRVKEIVDTLRQFSREERGKIGPVDIVQGIESSLLMLKNEWKNRITIHKNYAIKPIIEGNQNELNQVFLNILHNAILAIPEKGDLWIDLESGSSDTIKILIKDNGIGIPEEIRSRIFDPFFTTRPVGKGTGLGLSISYTIIQKHDGTIELESQPGKGSTFTIILPIKQKKVKQ